MELIMDKLRLACLLPALLFTQTCLATDKALLDILLNNKVIGIEQYNTLIKSATGNVNPTLLEVLMQNGAITQDQYNKLAKEKELATEITVTSAANQNTVSVNNQSQGNNDILHMHPGINEGGAPEPHRVGTEVFPGVHATFGGFIEAAGINRSKNESQDVNSNSNTFIPFNNSTNAYQSEFRESARQSRISLLMEGKYQEDIKLASYLEMDFLGVSSANSIQASPYSPRLRLGYATIDWIEEGWHFLGGQSWSLVTTNKVGISPRTENPPLTIDGGFIPGFNYARSSQLRLVKDFADHTIWAALSLESPQANLLGLTVPGTAYNSTASVTANNPGGGSLSPSVNYSTDVVPDIITKLAFDPGWGHYELFGMTRFFHSTINNAANTQLSNHTVESLGGGFAALLPVVPKLLDVQLNVMGGSGVGRYSTAQLPDVAFSTSGALMPLTQYTALLGIIAHPNPHWDFYTYFGGEVVNRYNQSVTGNLPSSTTPTATAYGYGNSNLNNYGCAVLGGACFAQTSSVWQITPGFWTTIYGGNAGTVKVGLQYAYTRRNAFSGLGGYAPHTDENAFLFSFRYYPLQK